MGWRVPKRASGVGWTGSSARGKGDGGVGGARIADGAGDINEQGRAEGFNDIVLGAEAEASKPRMLLFNAGEHNNLNVTRFRVCLQHVQNIPTVNRLTNIQEDDGGLVFLGQLDDFFGGGVGDNRHTEFFSFAHNGGDEEGVIIRNEDMGCRGHAFCSSKKRANCEVRGREVGQR